jgi:hypothetical protein
VSAQTFEIVDGPDKPALQRAVVYPDKGYTVVFKTNERPLEVKLSEMIERGDGLEFELKGQLISGDGPTYAVEGVYSIESRSGRINVLGSEPREFGPPRGGSVLP